ncbi:MAG: ABC transporter permease [Candidatus Aphodosoma sp.]
MNKISIIISQEYKNRVAKKSFILLTFLMPVLLAAVIFVPLWLASFDDDEERVLAVVDRTGLYGGFFRSLETDVCRFDVVEDADAVDTEDYRRNSVMLLTINDDLARNGNAVSIYSAKQVPNEVRRYVERELSDYVEHTKLEAYNIPGIEQMIADAQTSISVSTYKWDDDGHENSSDADIAMIIGMIATFVIYMFIFVSGSQVMSAVVDEKANRIVEVMVCSVKPWQLMWGKIIAVALTCLTQVVLWIVMTGALVAVFSGVVGIDMGSMQDTAAAGTVPLSERQAMAGSMLAAVSSINWTYIAVMFIVYFIGGYLLYASLFAAIGAAVNNANDTSQFMMPITIIVLFALYAGIYSAGNPDGPLAFWCSLIPFTSPIVMMVRIPFDVPVWQIAVSLGLLAVTVAGSIWLSAKIYRVGILMYGKKPSWGELIKWIRY